MVELTIRSEMTSSLCTTRLSDVSETQLTALLNDVVKVEKETWPEEIQASLEKFVARAEVFPQGFLLVSHQDLGLVGVSTAEIIDYKADDPPISWEGITDNGWIRGSHKEDGNALYVVSVGASPRAKGIGAGTRLVEEQKKLVEQLGLEYLVLGARVSGYAAFHQVNPGTSAEEYVAMQREDGLPMDAEIRFYSRCGLEVVKIVPNYMEDDPESENFGAVMVWQR